MSLDWIGVSVTSISKSRNILDVHSLATDSGLITADIAKEKKLDVTDFQEDS